MSTLTIQRYIRTHKNSMLCFVFLSALGTYLWRATQVLPPRIQCFIQNPVSDNARAQLKAYITAQYNQSIKPKEFIKNLKYNFLWIKEITLLMQPKFLYITILTHTPFVMLNNTNVLTKEGKSLDKDIFTFQTTAALPALTVQDAVVSNTNTLKDIALFMEELPAEVMDFYTIEWKNSHAIYLTDKANKNFALITSIDKPVSLKKLQNCLYIKKTLHTQLVKKTTDLWTADMRFADHIIVTKRGNIYGSHLS